MDKRRADAAGELPRGLLRALRCEGWLWPRRWWIGAAGACAAVGAVAAVVGGAGVTLATAVLAMAVLAQLAFLAYFVFLRRCLGGLVDTRTIAPLLASRQSRSQELSPSTLGEIEQALGRLILRMDRASAPDLRGEAPRLAALLRSSRLPEAADFVADLLLLARKAGMVGLEADARRLGEMAGEGEAIEAARQAARDYLAGVDSGSTPCGAAPNAGAARMWTEKLGSYSMPACAAAERQLLRLGDAAAGALVDWSREERRRRKTKIRSYTAILGVLVTAGCLLGWQAARSLDPVSADLWGIATRGVLHLCVFAGLLALYDLRERAAPVLARLEDRTAVPVLIEAMDRPFGVSIALVRAGLVRLLPRLTASDAGLLSRAQRQRLNGMLAGRNRALVLAILKAYEQVGTEAELPAVNALANGAHLARRNSEVREAARACAEYLTQRAERANQPRTLLRPSEPAGAEALGRPAAAGVSAEEALVRPSHGAEPP